MGDPRGALGALEMLIPCARTYYLMDGLVPSPLALD